MPTVRPPRTSSTSPTPRSPRLKPKLIRARSASVSVTVTQDITDSDVGALWIGKSCRFQVEQELLEIEGYQMYAVEKWIVERSRPVTVLTVYTGDPNHKITVTALTPSTSLSLTEAQAEWESALHHLRRDGARPKDVRIICLYIQVANCIIDTGWDTLHHLPSQLSFRFYHRPYPPWQLSRRQGAAIYKYRPLAHGMQWQKRRRLGGCQVGCFSSFGSVADTWQ